MSARQIEPLLLGYFAHAIKSQPNNPANPNKCRQTDSRLSWTRHITAGPEDHITTIASTGAGKGTGALIPNLLRNSGPAVVIDPKGENYLVTARARARMGHRVVLLDPFEVISRFTPNAATDQFNPLDVLRKENHQLEDDTVAMADMLVTGRSQTDPFWDRAACDLISGILAYLRSDGPKALQTLTELHHLLGDNYDGLRTFTQEELAGHSRFIQTKIGMTVASPEKTRGSIQTVALAHCGIFASKRVACATSRTSFSLDDFIAGKPMTIYIVFPPEKLRSHAALLRIWLACLIQLIARRTRAPEQITTLFVDEAAQLGTLDELRTAITLMRGYGVRLWTFWQDLSQLKSLYPKDWQSILNNSGVIQIFGRNQTLALNEMTSLCDPFCDDFSLFIPPGEQLLLRRDGPSLKATQLDYRYDPAFTGLFDPNPFYQKSVFSQSKADHDVENRRTFTQDLAPFDLNRGN